MSNTRNKALGDVKTHEYARKINVQDRENTVEQLLNNTFIVKQKCCNSLNPTPRNRLSFKIHRISGTLF